jgi:AraC-like DNA-binding protein
MTSHIDLADRGSAAIWVKGVAEALAKEGVDVPSLFEDLGLDFADLGDPDARFPTEKVSLLWRLAVQRTGDQMIGLRSSTGVMPAIFDIVAYAMMSAPNLLGMLEQLVRYVRILSDAAILHLVQDESECRLVLSLVGGKHAVPWQRIAFDLLSFLSFCRWVMIRGLRPLGIELVSPAAACLEAYEGDFGCKLNTNEPMNAVVFARSDLMRPLPTAHQGLAEYHRRVADEHLARLGRPLVSRRARAIIALRIAHGALTRAELAREMAMSERTLHRRLKAEHTSFQELMDDSRRELAMQYIRDRGAGLADVAYLLGFGDQSSFFRAFRRWFGMSPGQYRSRRTASDRAS